jgi:hypothetical protein
VFFLLPQSRCFSRILCVLGLYSFTLFNKIELIIIEVGNCSDWGGAGYWFIGQRFWLSGGGFTYEVFGASLGGALQGDNNLEWCVRDNGKEVGGVEKVPIIEGG